MSTRRWRQWKVIQTVTRKALVLAALCVAAVACTDSAASKWPGPEAAIPQTTTSDPPTTFDGAAAKHGRELEDLFQMRGAPLIALDDVSSSSLARVLSTRKARYEIEAGYPEQTSILFYDSDGSRLSIWLLDERGVRAHDRMTVTDSEIAAAIDDLIAALGVRTRSVTRIPLRRSQVDYHQSSATSLSWSEATAALTTLLIPPTIARELTQVRHLIVVPAGALGTVPFAMLQPFGPEASLIDHMSVSIAPSLFDIGQTIETWNPAFHDALVVGNPWLPPDPDWIVPSLPGAEAEATAAAAASGTVPLLGRAATKRVVESRAPDADFLYLATHGIASSDDPLDGGFLMLSADEFRVGWWTAREIQQMGLQARVAVLSACQTGLGQAHDAGIVGLARAFQIAGVPRVVMSLWNVDDEATADLMQAFIRHMSTSVPAEALRQSILEIRDARPHPSLWASFVLFGTPR